MTNPEEIYQRYNPMSKPASMTDIAFDTGVVAERERIIKLFVTSESACAEWAIALINGGTNA
jgi:hypothetical protein